MAAWRGFFLRLINITGIKIQLPLAFCYLNVFKWRYYNMIKSKAFNSSIDIKGEDDVSRWHIVLNNNVQIGNSISP